MATRIEHMLVRQRRPAVEVLTGTASHGHRVILVEWMVDLCHYFSVNQITAELSVSIMDQYISNTKNIGLDTLQLLGCTCLLIAGKVSPADTTTDCFDPKYLTEASDGAFEEQDLLEKEIAVLLDLEWDVIRPTASEFLSDIIERLDLRRSMNIIDHRVYVIRESASAILVSLFKYKIRAKYTPVTIAAAALLCADYQGDLDIKRQEWLVWPGWVTEQVDMNEVEKLARLFANVEKGPTWTNVTRDYAKEFQGSFTHLLNNEQKYTGVKRPRT
jgi:hypothetical protein